MKLLIAVATIATCLTTTLAAQTPERPAPARSPEALATIVATEFASGTPVDFAAVFPDIGVRALVRAAAQQGALREMSEKRVLWKNNERAVILFAGVTRPKDSTTTAARIVSGRGVHPFAGLYEAVESHGTWTVSRDLPVDSLNYIHSHAIHADLTPGTKLDVVDTMSVAVGAPYGLLVRLNPNIDISAVRLDGRNVAHAFGPSPAAGLLWIDAPVRPAATLVLSYALPEERRSAGRGSSGAGRQADSGRVDFGQYFFTDGWHAYLDINSPNDRGLYSVTATIPAEYHLTTSLPQTDTVIAGRRIVHGTSRHPQFLISLLYDRYWQPKQTQVGDLRVETFLRPDSRLHHDTAVAGFARVYKALSARFGPHNDPPYLAIVQAYGYPQPGCAQRQADLVICGAAVADSMTHVSFGGPQFAWAHETSHAWTMNADGPASTMLREGWAVYAEATVIGSEYPDLELAFWERARNGVMMGTEGRQSLIPPGPTGGFYSKGAWVFHMLEYVAGSAAFDRAIRAFSRTEYEAKPSGYPELIALMSEESHADLTSFVMPWLTGRFMPDLDGQMSGTKLIVSQKQPETTYDLPKLEVDFVSDAGVVRRTIHVTKLVDTIDVGNVGQVTGVQFDPNHHFLMQRRWGEVVRFELPAARVPNAKTVSITANRDQASFSIAPIFATREGDMWVVTLPLSAGHYPWHWEIDGVAPKTTDPTMSGIRDVRPVQRIAPYPR